jgi:hypothetical protein
LWLIQSLQQPIKVAFEKAILNKSVFLKFALGMSFGNFSRDPSCVLQDFPVSGSYSKKFE